MDLKKNPDFRVNLMGHVIAHEPHEAATEAMVEIMVEAGASVIEVQIPFSEPTADGPVFLKANHRALERGATFQNSLGLVEKLVERFGNRCDFLVMTYLNIPYQRGYRTFAHDLAAAGVKGTIIPDLPIEYGHDYEEALRGEGLFNVRLVAPHGDWNRCSRVLEGAQGLVYAVARRGVTGAASAFDQGLFDYLQRLRSLTSCPIALGFGIQSQEAVKILAPHVDWVVVGTASLVAWQGAQEAGLRSLWRELAQVAKN